LLSRWDLHNLIALLRGGATSQPSEETLANMIPLGALSEALAREVARQREFAGAVELLVRWRLPDPETARSLREAWPEYERTENLAALEHAVMYGWALRAAAALARAGTDGGGLRRVFEREVDRRNVLVALRRREALGRGEVGELPGLADHDPYLPGGAIRPGLLDTAVRLPDPESITAEIAGAAPETWRAPLERWARSGDLIALQGELESVWIAEAVALFYRGDPLGVDVPVAYAIAKETEARNLRVVAEGAARGFEPYIVRAQLVFVVERSVPG
ncbi:MAG TPA: V-type ATPase subunit, partial [Rubrobacteraceae bacterium]|nr:V-type ATPase subunit [Rubrobacteraceae bacterium]